MTKPSSSLSDIWEHSQLSWWSCSCLYPMWWLISCYADQSENRGGSVALLNSWLICFSLSFIHLLGEVRGGGVSMSFVFQINVGMWLMLLQAHSPSSQHSTKMHFAHILLNFKIGKLLVLLVHCSSCGRKCWGIFIGRSLAKIIAFSTQLTPKWLAIKSN